MILKFNKTKILNLLIFIAYFGLTFLVMIKHERWRDEAQIWLEVRDLDLKGIYRTLGYTGGGALWQSVLFPLAKNGFPYISMKIANYFAVLAASIIFIFYSPFNFFFKIFLLMSYIFFYEYPAFARSNGLAVCLIILTSHLFKIKFRKPVLFFLLVFFLVNSNIFGLIFGVNLILASAIELIEEKLNMKKLYLKRFFAGLVIGISGVVLTYIQMNQDVGGRIVFELFTPAPVEGITFEIFNSILSNISNAFFLSSKTGMIFSIGIILLIFFSIRNFSIKILFVSLFSELLLFYYLFERVEYRHLGFVIIFTVSILWISFERIKNKNLIQILFIILLSFQIPYAVKAYKLDVKLNYSDSKNAAEFLKQKKFKNKILIGCSSNPEQLSNHTSIMPYLPDVKLYDVFMNEYITFMKYNVHKFSYRMSLDEIAVESAKKFDKKDLIFICDSVVYRENQSPCDLLKIYEPDAPVIDCDEKFSIYFFKN